MRVHLLFGVALMAAALHTPLAAQDHSSHRSDSPPEKDPKVDHCAMGHLPPEQCPPKDEHDGHDGMDHGSMDHGSMDHSGHGDDEQDEHTDHSAMDHNQHGETPDKSVPGAAPEEAVPARAFEGPRHAADAIWGVDAMAPSRDNLARENRGMRTGSVLIERLEARIAADGGEDGYVWDAQAFYGGDINRFVLKTEGEGEFGGELEDAEIQALYSRALGPFFDLQAGVRQDFVAGSPTQAVLGVQGLAPYMFHVDAALFVSTKGDLTIRIEAEYDQKITQQLILQPRIELEASAQDIPDRAIGAGPSAIEAGLRLRYEIIPNFAPYVGVEYEAKLGQTADIASAEGEDSDGFKFLLGLRAWF